METTKKAYELYFDNCKKGELDRYKNNLTEKELYLADLVVDSFLNKIKNLFENQAHSHLSDCESKLSEIYFLSERGYKGL